MNISATIRRLMDNLLLTNKPMDREDTLIEIDRSARVSIEEQSGLNIRIHRVDNGWVVNSYSYHKDSHLTQTRVCKADENVMDVVEEVVSLYKIK